MRSTNILAAAALVSLSGLAAGQSDPGLFSDVFNIGSDPNAGVTFDAASVGGGSGLLTLSNLTGNLLGSDSQLNLYDGGTILSTAANEFFAGPGNNIEVNMFGGVAQDGLTLGSGVTLNIFDGVLAPNGGGFPTPFVFADGGAIVNMVGGDVQGNLTIFNGSSLHLSGGSVDLLNVEASTVRVTGGAFGTGFLMSTAVQAYDFEATGGSIGTILTTSSSGGTPSRVRVDGVSPTGSLSLTGPVDVELANATFGNVSHSRGLLDVQNATYDRSNLTVGAGSTALIQNSTIAGAAFRVNPTGHATVFDSMITAPTTVTDASLELVGSDAGSVTVVADSVEPGVFSEVLIDGGVVGSVNYQDNTSIAGLGTTGLRVDLLSGDLGSFVTDERSSAQRTVEMSMSGGSIGSLTMLNFRDRVEISGGSIGPNARMRVASLDVSGGSIGDNAEISGQNNSDERIDIRGGVIGNNLDLSSGNGLLGLLNGSIGADATISGIQNFIGGGTFGPQFAMQAINLAVAAGEFTGNVFFDANSSFGVEIGGGTFLGRTHIDASRVTIYGSDFELNGTPINTPLGQPVVVPERSGFGFDPFPNFVRFPQVLSGTFLDGTPFSFDLGEVDGLFALLDSFDGTNVIDPLTTLILDLDTELVIVNTDPRNFDPFGFVGFDLTPNGFAPAGFNDEPGDEGVTTNDLIFMLNLINRNAERGDVNDDGINDFFDISRMLNIFDGNG
ncbi:MAG: hypothetical protein Tsb0013_07630 [Phycisphaerales bacterium]